MKLLLAVLTFATSLLSIQCRPQAVHFFPYHATELAMAPYPPFATSQVYAVGSVGRGFSRLVPVPYQARFYPALPTTGPEHAVRLPSSPPPQVASPEKLEQPKSTMSAGSNGGTKRLRSKKPKRVMNAPFLQALQQPSGQFKLQAYELVGTAEKLQQPQGPLKKELELQRQQLPPGKPSRPKSKTSGTNTATSAGNPVVVSSTGSTTADAPVGRVPVAPTVSEYYPFYGSPMTDQREEASLILEPSSKAISGNGGTAISTPVSHAILKHGSSTKILFRPESVAIVGANGRAHAQADLIVDYVK